MAVYKIQMGLVPLKFEEFLDHFIVNFVIEFNMFMYSINESNFLTMFPEEYINIHLSGEMFII